MRKPADTVGTIQCASEEIVATASPLDSLPSDPVLAIPKSGTGPFLLNATLAPEAGMADLAAAHVLTALCFHGVKPA
ncbi:hypothetical protein HY009_10805 [Candidatus Acetothermia bacterium]|nr:hypothetical protein [Candidatus Acetothermia bacterium]